MARGWESKSVESQIDDRRAEKERTKDHRSVEELARARERESLELSRTRVMRELDATDSDLRRASLRAALAYLDEQLRKLDK